MARIAFIGDVHLAQPKDVHPFDYQRRKHYIEQYPFVKKMLQHVNDQSPDLTVFLGDVIDWYSPSNIIFALEILDTLKTKWLITPGNHDVQLAVHQRTVNNNNLKHEWNDFGPYICLSKATQDWANHGIHFGFKSINLGDTNLILVDSHLGFIPEAQLNLVASITNWNKHNFFATHTPFRHEALSDIIKKNKNTLDIEEFQQDDLSNIFDNHLKDKFQKIFLGHVHFSSNLTIGGTQIQTLATSCQPGKSREFEGVAILDC